MVNYVISHWQGLQPLRWAFWINGIACMILVIMINRIFSIEINKFNDVISVIFYVGIWGAIRYSIWVWQLVGIWRSSTAYREGGGLRVWFLLVRVCMILGWIILFGSAGQAIRSITYLLQEYDILQLR